MSQDDALRMAATVVDNFSGPLKNLRKQMQDLSREGGVHNETLAKGFRGVESSAQAAEKAISSGLRPALGVIGITGLSATAAIAGIAAAMRNFAAGAASLGALSRETGQTADNLRILGAVASKFGVDQDAVASGTRNFAAQMREFGRGIGETYQWLNRQGRDAAGRKHFQDFAADLRATTDRGEQLRKVLREMENISDPVERGMFAEKFFGNADFGKLGDKHFGPILEMWKKTAQKLGPLDPAAVKSAEDFERTMSDLSSSMKKLGTTIGQEVLPYASQFTTWLSDVVGGQRSDVVDALRKGLKDIRGELDGINWAQAGKDAKDFLVGTATFASDTVKALKAVATLLSALKDLKDGNFAEALKKIGDADKATDLGLGQGRAPGTIQDQFKADTGPLLQRQQELQSRLRILDESIARKENGYDATGENRVVDAEGRAKRERLIDETRKLSDEIRRLREDPAKKAPGEATVQQQSFDASGGRFGGARIQTASLGGLAGAAQVGRMLGGSGGIVLPGGGYGGGALGALRSAPDYDRLTGREGGADIGGGLRGRPFGAPRVQAPGANTPAGKVGRDLRGGAGPEVSAKYPDGLADGIRQTAQDLGISARDVATAISYETGGTFDPWKRGPTTKWGVHRGLIQWGEPQQRKYGVTADMTPGQQMQAVTRYLRDAGVRPGMGLEEIYSAINAGRVGRMGASDRPGFTVSRHVAEMRGPHGRRADALLGARTTPNFRDFLQERARTTKFGAAENETQPVDRERNVNLKEVQGGLDALAKQYRGATGDGETRSSERFRDLQRRTSDPAYKPDRELTVPELWKYGPDERSDGRSFDTMYKARQEVEDERRKALELRPAARSALQGALRGGTAGATEGAERALLDVHIRNPGPNTRADVTTKGSLFREITQSRGRQMQAAGDDV